jgi:Tfp pilus assembly protein PilW
MNLQKLYKLSGISLTELLVSSILIGVVMTGVMGFSYAIKAIEQTSDAKSQATIRATSIMSFMRRDASLAVGNPNDPGVTTWATNAPAISSICFRHDVNETPFNYTDDDWVCYAHNAAFLLFRCVHSAAGHVMVDNPGLPCTTMAQCCTNSGEEFEVGQLDPNAYDLSVPDTFYTVTGNVERIDLHVTTTEVDTGGGAFADPVISFDASVDPVMHTAL